MASLYIDPSELLPAGLRAPPRLGMSVSEWNAFRARTPQIAPPIRRRRRKTNRKSPIKLTPELEARILELLPMYGDRKIAQMVGSGRAMILRIRHKAGIKPHMPVFNRGVQIVPTPEFVPLDMVERFRELVVKRGTDKAVKWVRCRLLGKTQPGLPPGSKVSRHTFIGRKIIAECASSFNVEVEDVLGPSRVPAIAYARHVAAYLMRKATGRPLLWIGERLGSRDHTTILNSIRRVEERMGVDPEFAARVSLIERRIVGVAE